VAFAARKEFFPRRFVVAERLESNRGRRLHGHLATPRLRVDLAR
jgi:hypothetical protein